MSKKVKVGRLDIPSETRGDIEYILNSKDPARVNWFMKEAIKRFIDDVFTDCDEFADPDGYGFNPDLESRSWIDFKDRNKWDPDED